MLHANGGQGQTYIKLASLSLHQSLRTIASLRTCSKVATTAAATATAWITVRHTGLITPIHIGTSDQRTTDKILDSHTQYLLIPDRTDVWFDPWVRHLPAYKHVRWDLRPVILEPHLDWGVRQVF